MEPRKTFQLNFDSSFQSERWSTARAVLSLAVCMLGATIFAMAQSSDGGPAPDRQRIIEFEAPGAGSTPGLGTQGGDISLAGAIMGIYADENNLMHGFLRTPQGRLITFDAPGAGSEGGPGPIGTPAGVTGGQGTYPFSNNPEGAVTGFYIDENDLGHGFVRAPDGTFTTFDDPDAGTIAGSYQRTAALNINPAGLIAGNYLDSNSIHHGFVRTPGGKFTNFDPPGSVFTFVCVAECINPAGAVNGYYLDAEGLAHGFARAPDGRITEFEDPDAGTDGSQGQGTYPGSINTEGAWAGEYVSADNVAHGFVRAADGRITNFDAPGAGTNGSQGQGTYPEAINDRGEVAGQYIDSNDVQHGFVRTPDGRIITFDAPGAGSDAGSYEGTIPLTINAAGEIAGAYIDSNWVLHGFLRLAGPPWFR